MVAIYQSKGEASASPIRPFLAIPAYSGMPGVFVFSLWSSHHALKAADMPATVEILEEHCHVDDSRNLLVRDFLESDCTDLVFLDADIGWNAADLVRLLRVDRNIVGGVYPLKQSPAGFPVRPIPGEIRAEADGCVEVEGVPTGFLRIRRHVLEDLWLPSHKFRGREESADREHIGIIFERDWVDGERLGGDYNFCRKAKEAGHKIYTIPDMHFQHHGDARWSGSLGDYWRREHGITLQLFETGIEKIKAGTESYIDYLHICEHWGNIPWAAGAGLVQAWVETVRNFDGAVLECGTGITSILAAAANPDVMVYALDHDRDWGAKTQATAMQYGIANLEVVFAPLVDGWYQLPDDLPRDFDAVLIDGPPRDKGERVAIQDSTIDLSNTIVFWDDMDQASMRDRVASLAERFNSQARFVEHETKDFAVAIHGNSTAND